MYNLGLSEHHPEEELDYTLSSRFVFAYIDLKNHILHKNDRFL